MAALTKYQIVCLKQQKSISSQFWGWKSELKVSAGLVSSEGLCPWRVDGSTWSSCHLFLCLIICVSYNNLTRTPVILNWHHFALITSLKIVAPNTATLQGIGGLGLKHMNWGEAMIHPITSSLLIWCSNCLKCVVFPCMDHGVHSYGL